MSTEKPKRPIEAVRGENFHRAFINTYRLSGGEQHLALTFGFTETETDGKKAINEEFQAIMTPRTLKIIMLGMSQVVKNIETRFGEIKLPPGKEDAIKKSIKMIDALPNESSET